MAAAYWRAALVEKINTQITKARDTGRTVRIPKTLVRRVRALLHRVESAEINMSEVLVGPLRFTPEGKRYRFEGEAAIGRLLAGSADLAPFMASPTGPGRSWTGVGDPA